MSEPRPRVLMVTGAYAPETSGASLQCRNLIRALRDRADFTVLTTSTDPALPWNSIVDDTQVRRVTVDPNSHSSKAFAIERMASSFLELASGIDIVHLHGVSQKSMLVVALAKLLGKTIVIKLTSFGHDDPASIRAKGALTWAAYRQADRFIGVTPRFAEGFDATGLEESRFVFIPNGVDLDRFKPSSVGVRAEFQNQLRIPTGDPVILFVGSFSPEKNPDVLFEAWLSLFERGVRSTLVLVGATQGPYYEIDAGIADRIKSKVAKRGVSESVVFVEAADNIEHYFRAADVFALPTAREGLPNVLLEAMASGVPPVITRLEGVTDWIVTPGVTGELVAVVDSKDFADAIEGLLASPERREAMGAAARAHVAAHFSLGATAQQTLDLYQELLKGHSS
ncbi:MAG TPA: glycosyltransferase family 4 protein [Vicinamibacterales bacterium]|nr:glycosyltransferase family 4 protein [Vicinamibacterales bacterium]